jgi:TPR repeat protein
MGLAEISGSAARLPRGYPAGARVYKIPELKKLAGAPLKSSFLYGDFLVENIQDDWISLRPLGFVAVKTDIDEIRRRAAEGSLLLGESVIRVEAESAPELRKGDPLFVSPSAPLELSRVVQRGRVITAEARFWVPRAVAARPAGEPKAPRGEDGPASTGLLGGAPAKQGPAPETKRRLAEYVDRARAGDITAQLELGASYLEGVGIERDEAKAAEWLGRAAEQGDATAELLMGAMHAQGRGLAADPNKAIEYYCRAAGKKQPIAELNLAVLILSEPDSWGDRLLRGQGLAHDDVKAAELIAHAANSGLARAQRSLSELYRQGRGVPVDDDKANRWRDKAAQNNDAASQFELGLKFFRMVWDEPYAEDCEKKWAAALGWTEKAASNGFPDAQYHLYDAYRGAIQDVGVQDGRKAFHWLVCAASGGHAEAIRTLAALLRDGKGFDASAHDRSLLYANRDVASVVPRGLERGDPISALAIISYLARSGDRDAIKLREEWREAMNPALQQRVKDILSRCGSISEAIAAIGLGEHLKQVQSSTLGRPSDIASHRAELLFPPRPSGFSDWIANLTGRFPRNVSGTSIKGIDTTEFTDLAGKPRKVERTNERTVWHYDCADGEIIVSFATGAAEEGLGMLGEFSLVPLPSKAGAGAEPDGRASSEAAPESRTLTKQQWQDRLAKQLRLDTRVPEWRARVTGYMIPKDVFEHRLGSPTRTSSRASEPGAERWYYQCSDGMITFRVLQLSPGQLTIDQLEDY